MASKTKSAFDLSAYLDKVTKTVDKGLDKLLPSETTKPPTIHKAMRYSLFAGGKRMRPAVCLAAAEACGGKDEDAMPLACAVECIHTYSLIHDDLPAMDDADLRRGKPSCHKAFSESTAILAARSNKPFPSDETMTGTPARMASAVSFSCFSSMPTPSMRAAGRPCCLRWST